MPFDSSESADCERLVEWGIREDLGDAGDITSRATIPVDLRGEAVIVARQPGVIAGLPAIAIVLARIDPGTRWRPEGVDGQAVGPGAVLGRIDGPIRSLLAAERLALNILQRLSGVATLTRRYVEAVAGSRARIYDTRKTTPGWRRLEKYAVRCGGGANHRLGLFDAVLIKDNHLAALADDPDPVGEAIRRARHAAGPSVEVEVEVDTLDQLDAALAAQPDLVLLDNMAAEQLAEAVRRRDRTAPRVRLEASGGVNLATIAALAATGVDRISIGALTHSAPALDLGMDYDRSGP